MSRATQLLLVLAMIQPGAAAEDVPARKAGTAGEPGAEPATAAPPMEFETFQLVLLRRGPAWTPDVTEETTKIQEQHLGHMMTMWKKGKMVVAGPFDKQEDETLRGMCLYRVATPEEARELASQDPAVKTGRLKVEVLTWWVEKGVLAFPKQPPAE